MVFKPSNVLKQKINEMMIDGSGGLSEGEHGAVAENS
jgi:hypothetical protein